MRGFFHTKQSNSIRLLLSIAQVFLCAVCAAQQENGPFLNQLLHTLPDSARIDRLNQLSHHYITSEKKDSADYYARLAFEEAKKVRYINGMAISLSRQAQIAKHFDDDFIKSEALCKESLGWYSQTENKTGLDDVFHYLIYALLAQSKFDEGIHYGNEYYAFAKRTGNQLEMISALSWIHALYRTNGDYEKSFLYAQRRYEFALKTNNKSLISGALYNMAQLYELIEDYPNALVYFRRVLQMDDDNIRKERIATDNDIWFKMEFAEAFSNLGQFDSAWHYYNLFKPTPDKAVYLRVWWVSTGECYFLQKDYKRALQHFHLGLAEHRKRNDRNEVMRTLLDIGKTYLALNKNAEALQYGQEGLLMALQTTSKRHIRDGYEILATVYERRHQADSANHYFRQYIAIKEAVLDAQARGKFAAYAYTQRIALLNKERQMQEVKLKEATFYRDVLIGGITGLLILGVFCFRNIILKRRNEKQRLEHDLEVQKLESEKTKVELQHQASELEMQALRAQMSPHFIFNSLNSINHFILRNNKAQASEYLIKFSQLIRMILQNSQLPLISLESELEALQLYLDLEALRFDHSFDYTITTAEDVDLSMVQVPPLIIQPYAENAIWHGLMNKKERGHLEITIFQQEAVLCCRISDNGIGRKKAAELKNRSASTYKSMGIRITADRIAMLHQNSSDDFITITDFLVADGLAGGTEVTLKLPLLYAENNFDR